MVISVSCFIFACDSSEKLTQQYKQSYFEGLVRLCENKKSCIEIINKHFEQCLNMTQVKQMLAAKGDKQTELNQEIVNNTMACIEKASGLSQSAQ